MTSESVPLWRVAKRGQRGKWGFGPNPDTMFSWSAEQGQMVYGYAETQDIGQAICDAVNAAQQPDDALRVAAQETIRAIADYFNASSPLGRGEALTHLDEAGSALKAALDGAPFEPSEEIVARAVEWMRQVPVWDEGELMPDAWPNLARAALRAAFNSGESPSGTDQRPTDQR